MWETVGFDFLFPRFLFIFAYERRKSSSSDTFFSFFDYKDVRRNGLRNSMPWNHKWLHKISIQWYISSDDAGGDRIMKMHPSSLISCRWCSGLRLAIKCALLRRHSGIFANTPSRAKTRGRKLGIKLDASGVNHTVDFCFNMIPIDNYDKLRGFLHNKLLYITKVL